MRSPRMRLLVLASLCLGVLAVLGMLVWAHWDPLQDLDTSVGRPAQMWSYRHPAAVTVLIAIEAGFGTIGSCVYGLVLVVGLLSRGRRRAAVWAAVVMIAASASTTALKLLFHKGRPQWDDPVRILTSYSFPSGHASGIASGMGVLAVIVVLYVRRTVVRRCVLAAAGALVVVVGADRILLGVHNLSDVVAGYALGAFWVLSMLALYPPEMGAPTRPATGSPVPTGPSAPPR
jgi:membrane-associated phospholipid phosphatase